MSNLSIPPLKRCPKCGEEKLATPNYFNRNARNEDGLSMKCKACLFEIHEPCARVIPEDGYKHCASCKQQKPATSDFWGYRKNTKDNLSTECIDCMAVKRRVYYVEHREHAIEYSSQYERDHREQINANHRDWNKRNPGRASERNERWKKNNRAKYLAGRHRRYQRHKEKNCKEAREWRERNPDLVRFYWKVRQARIRTNGGNHTMHDIRRIFLEQEERCAYCGITLFWYLKGDIHVDHFASVLKGGSNNPDNLRCACQDCNLSKKDKAYEEWVLVRGW
jgi:hypothetical protein